MRARRAIGGALLVGVLISVGLAAPLSAAVVFYERLKESGILAYAQGDYRRAADELRLACFGLLDEPANLAEGLTYLALSQAELGDEAAFEQTFGRILEVERRFQAFSALDLSIEMRAALEAHLERWIAVEVLERAPAFSDVLRRKREALILELPPDERRRELERLIAAEPDDLAWRLWLAELALSTGDAWAAFEAAEELLVRAPELAAARCLRGRAGAALDRCQQALVDLAACGAPDGSRDLTAIRLRCAVVSASWDEADALIAQLSPEELRAAPFKQLARAVRRGKKAAAQQAAAVAEAAVESPEAAAESPAAVAAEVEPLIDPDAGEREPAAAAAEPSSPAVGAAPPETPAADPVEPAVEAAPAAAIEAELERIRERLRRAGARDELAETFARARRIADDHPQLAEAQLVTAEVAYRLSRWHDAVSYFQRVEDLEARGPDRQFYFSVALYEAGDRSAAREMLQRCLAFLEPTRFVESYAAKILDGG